MTKKIVLLFFLMSCTPLNAMQQQIGYMYYPVTKDYLGHAELEVGGICYSLHCGTKEKSYLQKRIELEAQTSKGYPFYLYVINVTPKQLKKLKTSLHSYKGSWFGFTCSGEVLKLLAENTDFKVPIPFRVSPLLSSLYLDYAPKLIAPCVQEVRFYTNKEKEKFILRGKCLEAIVLFAYASFVVSYVVYVINNYVVA